MSKDKVEIGDVRLISNVYCIVAGTIIRPAGSNNIEYGHTVIWFSYSGTGPHVRDYPKEVVENSKYVCNISDGFVKLEKILLTSTNEEA